MTTLIAGEKEKSVQLAKEIPGATHAEAGELAQAEFERLLAVIQSLEGESWDQPTFCTEWNVRDVVAHLAGSSASNASWAEFKRQTMQNPYLKEFEQQVDGINKRQLEDRAGRNPSELVDELRHAGPRALRTRRRLPWILRYLRLPMGPPLGFSAIGYLTDIIFTRDQWMHRIDICAATGEEMVMTAVHDGRIVALVLRDLARKLKNQLQGKTIDLVLSGAAGGAFRFGDRPTAYCTIEMDLIDFNLLASGRISTEGALSKASFEGDRNVATWFLNKSDVPY